MCTRLAKNIEETVGVHDWMVLDLGAQNPQMTTSANLDRAHSFALTWTSSLANSIGECLKIIT